MSEENKTVENEIVETEGVVENTESKTAGEMPDAEIQTRESAEAKVDLSKMTLAELKEYATENEIDIAGLKTKALIIARIKGEDKVVVEKVKSKNQPIRTPNVGGSGADNFKCVSGKEARKYPSLEFKAGQFIKVGIFNKLVAKDDAERLKKAEK